MPEYIDKEKAIDLFYPIDPENDGLDGCTVALKSGTYTSEEIESMLSSLPVADVAPVIHAKWIDVYGCFETAECSSCHSQFEVTFNEEANRALWDGFNQFYKYCPYCGAKMDLEGK